MGGRGKLRKWQEKRLDRALGTQENEIHVLLGFEMLERGDSDRLKGRKREAKWKRQEGEMIKVRSEKLGRHVCKKDGGKAWGE
jgi:hypothetical protein